MKKIQDVEGNLLYIKKRRCSRCHLFDEADADDGGEEEEVADDEGGDVVGGPGQLCDLVHDQTYLEPEHEQ